MPAATHPKTAPIRRIVPWLAMAAICGLTACMATDAGDAPPTEAAEPAPALQEKATGKPGVPAGCTREWSGAARDSVLNCPDVLPPSPR
jgi:hypothetical protein